MKALFLENAPMTKEALGLGLTEQLQKDCRVVYEKDGLGGYVFHSLWDPAGNYGSEHIILPVGSTYDGLTDEYPAGEYFANVMKSSDDPLSPVPDVPDRTNSWIDVIKLAYKKENVTYDINTCCAERNIIYRSDTGNTVSDFRCTAGGTGSMKGAHVLMGERASREGDYGGNVYLLPLCSAHNISQKCGGHGTGYYMRLERPMKAVMLRGYMKDPEE